MFYQIKYFLTALLLFSVSGLLPCTIGLIRSEYTANNRPLMWKTRDRGSTYANNYPLYNSNGVYHFVGFVDDTNELLTWAGVNSQGFAILNAQSDGLPGLSSLGNGSFMTYSLQNFTHLQDFENYLNETNVSGRTTKGNFAVMDRFAGGAMYEIANSTWYKYDLEDSSEGFIIRTNFSFHGDNFTGLERYERSQTIISELINTDLIVINDIVNAHFRDFSDQESYPLSIPFLGSTLGNWGYLDNRYSICRNISTGGLVIEGINEESQIPILWAISGFPAVTPIIPYLPLAFQYSQVSIPLLSQTIKSQLMNINSYLINTLFFLNDNQTGIWNLLRQHETTLIDSFYLLELSDYFPDQYQDWLENIETQSYYLMNEIYNNLLTKELEPPTLPLTQPSFKLYPNPHQGDFRIMTQYKFVSDYTVEVFNVRGQRLYYEQKQQNTPLESIKISSSLPVGVYFIRIIDEDKSFTLKSIIMK